jgi:hypothetical protein
MPRQVEYFAQKLDGMFFTQQGWVQSYGSRYVRPPLFVGDVRWTAPMTVREFKVGGGGGRGARPAGCQAWGLLVPGLGAAGCTAWALLVSPPGRAQP